PMVAELKKQLGKLGRMPEEVMSSSSSSRHPTDFDSVWMDAFCQDFSSQCRHSNAVDTQQARWDSLPWPAVDRICYHLFDRYDSSDLADLAHVSTHYLSGVNTFMNRAGNKPGVYRVTLEAAEDGLDVTIHLIPSNLLFHGLADVDSGRLWRYGNSENPILEFILNGTEDPVFEKISGLLSVSI
ncbi:hypothetical protein PMAYCL1PPCAC_20885, partial [Pristionchus mayeri]